ncbi:MAG: M23 family metallopeptidase [Paludibacter sp.]|jgi:lipoprotein NlpD|nr:M23 family metallopeptidase [Paludibacter sp.]
MTKKSKLKKFFHKIRFQYRVSVLNENTLEESWHFRLSRLSVMLYVSLFVLITFILLAILIIATPIRYYLPGYGSMGDRATFISKSITVDSLEHQLQLHSQYLTIIKGIVAGDVQSDSLIVIDSIGLTKIAEDAIEQTKAEQKFIAQYEQDEKYNIDVNPSNTNKRTVFYRPAKGVITPVYSDNRYGISIATGANEPIMSVLDGTVVMARLTFDYGWVIQIQHTHDFLSVYKNNTKLYKSEGDRVKAGEVIAVAGGGSLDNANQQFYFELWHNGDSRNPNEEIIF